MNYTLKQLRYFLAVAEHGNVTSASEAMYVSQPAISTAINHLEETLGIQLLIRYHAKGVELTLAGRSLVVAATSLLAHAEELEIQAKELNTSLVGKLPIGCFKTLGPFLLPRLIKEFNQIYPGVRFEMTEQDTESLQSDLLSGQIELALMYDMSLDEHIHTETLAEINVHVIFAKTHRFANRKTVSLSEFIDEPFILLDMPHSREYFQSIFTKFGFTPNIQHRTSNYESVRAMVANEQGFSLLNLKPHPNVCYDGSEVTVVNLKEKAPPLRIVLATVKDVRQTNRAKHFLDFCRENANVVFNYASR